MKVFVIGIFAMLLLVSSVTCDLQQVEEDVGPLLRRARRFTCDVLSFEAGTVKVNHSACALHCVGLGKKGGYCNDKGVCYCRN